MRCWLAVALALTGAGCDDGGAEGAPADATAPASDARPADAGARPDAEDTDAAPDAAPRTDDAAPPVDEDVDWQPEVPAAVGADIPDAPTDRPAECAAEWVSVVRGWVVAPGGAPLPGAKAQVCLRVSPSNTLRCLRPGDADAEGVFTVQVPDEVRCVSHAAMRVLLPGSGKAATYCEVDVTGAPPVLRLPDPLVLFQTRPALDLPPEGDRDAERPIVIDDGLVLDLVPRRYYTGAGTYEDIAGRRVPVDARGLCFLDDGPPLDGLYALYPEGSVDAPGAPVHLPNTTGLPPGTTVELFVLGGLDCRGADGRTLPEASWTVFGTGTVRADGTMIDSDPGVGLPCLTWLGYRRAP
ncbi:MAG: hypothetical protein H6704_02775 [Myxococcales bacterium]|nr:hypothetical protein [Myxococcales bacterium]